jgi:ABC-type transporter Mla MlaB component
MLKNGLPLEVSNAMVLGFFKKPEKMPERTAVRPDGARVSPVREAEAKPKPAPAAHQPFDLDDTFYSGGSYGIEIQEESDIYADMAEHAAMSYAAGQDSVARGTLQSIVKGNSDPAALKLWAMLFDLLRLMGERDAFNMLGLEFAQTCELSPPSWGMPDSKGADAQNAEEGDPGCVMVQGALVGDDPLFTKLLEAMSSGEVCQINFGRLAGLDGEAAAKLAKLLNQARRRKLGWTLEGAEGLSTRLGKRTVAGMRKNESLWVLLLELYQYLGKAAEFEEKSLDYAITFEVSPPSWEGVGVAPPAKRVAPLRQEKPKPAESLLSGELLGGELSAIKALLKPGAECRLDFSQITRVDFDSAVALKSLIAASRASVLIFHPNRMVAEILRMAGVDQVAKVELSKH